MEPWRSVDAYSGGGEALNAAVEYHRPMVGDSNHSDEEMYPDPHQSDKSNPDSRQCVKSDPDPHRGDVDLRRMACKVPSSWRGYTRVGSEQRRLLYRNWCIEGLFGNRTT
jgi:hypothetical protein